MATRLIDAELHLAPEASREPSPWHRVKGMARLVASATHEAAAAERTYRSELADSLSHEKAAARTFEAIYGPSSKR